MNIAKDKVISVSYELRTSENGEIVEKTQEENPLTFLFGHGNMLPKFESNLEGLKQGDKFEFKLDSQDAYGKYNPKAVIDVPKSAFEVEGKVDEKLLQLGATVPMMDNNGNRFNGIVKEILDEKVKMDFNHPMADQNLFFNGEILEIREASENELKHGHVHQGGEDHECTDCGKH